jgi:hypothetical protein
VTEFITEQKKYKVCLPSSLGGLEVCASGESDDGEGLWRVKRDSDEFESDLEEDEELLDATPLPTLSLTGPYHYEVTTCLFAASLLILYKHSLTSFAHRQNHTEKKFLKLIGSCWYF